MSDPAEAEDGAAVADLVADAMDAIVADAATPAAAWQALGDHQFLDLLDDVALDPALVCAVGTMLGGQRLTLPWVPAVLARGIAARSPSLGRCAVVGPDGGITVETANHDRSLTGTCRAWLADATCDGLVILPRDVLQSECVLVVDCADSNVAAVEAEALVPGNVVAFTLTAVTARTVAIPGLATLLRLAWITQLAEMAGTMRSLVDATADYVRQREQFGRALQTFQVVRHQIADMAVAAAQTRALADAAVERPLATIHAARIVASADARLVWQTAVQLHGGIGVSAESPIADAVRRLIALDRMLGSVGWHAGQLLRSPHPVTGAYGEMEDGDYTATADRIDRRLSAADRAARAATIGFFSAPQAGRRWHATLAALGVVAPAWPVDHGGTPMSPRQRYLTELAAHRAGAPLHNQMGIRMVGPIVARFGTDAQRDRFLPLIRAGQLLWCQGFSEPGSGSDLASLRTRAVRDGENYVVNGTKIWTTHAHHADWMFALFRTSSEGPHRAGLGFFLLDMRTPGITVTPIAGIDGEADLNQVFFDEVRVPVANRIGAEGQGWTIAKALLELERGGGFAGPELRARCEQMPVGDDPLLRRRFAELLAMVTGYEELEIAAFDARSVGLSEAALASTLKLKAALVRQATSQFAIELQGGGDLALDHATRTMLADRAHSIFGGASAVQRDLIAHTVLGPSQQAA